MENKITISKEILLRDGYKEYFDKNLMDYGKEFFQKRFVDEKGVKFFINVTHDIFTFQPDISSWWTFSIQFDTEFGSVEIKTIQWFNEDGKYSKNNHLHAEHYLEKIWMANGKPYYKEFANVKESK